MHFLSFLFASLALIFSLPAAHAIDAGMPTPPSKPTIVKCGLFVLDIVDIVYGKIVNWNQIVLYTVESLD